MTMNLRTRALLAVSLFVCLAGCGDKNQKGEVAATDQRTPTGGVASTGAAESRQAEEAQVLDGPKGNPNTPLEAYKPLTSGDQLMAHYFALVGIPDDVSTLAGFDRGYQRAQGDFARRDRLVKYRAELVAAAAEAKAARYVVFDLPEFASIGRGALGGYDFEENAFQLRFFALQAARRGSRFGPPPGPQQSGPSQEPGNGLTFGDNNYSSLYFSNWRDFEYLAIPDEAKAREIDGQRDQYRKSDGKGVLRIRVYASINAPMRGKDLSVASNSVQAQIMKIQLMNLDGKVLAEK